ncbi:MAG: hypothetical protein M4579_005479 [Chaenotheca gracillima]|nr:MAG: hypothetical protein M4579_005479 [Chaenotheca gracillima]
MAETLEGGATPPKPLQTSIYKERLEGHARSFDGLLSLIPAKYYYGDDNTDQWQRKKQTKKQAREAKLAKLDPDSAKSAKDVLDERANKRKRDDDDNDDDSDVEGLDVPKEQPKEGLKDPVGKRSKKQKKDEGSMPNGDGKHPEISVASTAAGGDDKSDQRIAKAEKRKAKRERKRLQKAAKEERKLKKKDARESGITAAGNGSNEKSGASSSTTSAKADRHLDTTEMEAEDDTDQVETQDVDVASDNGSGARSSSAQSAVDDPPIFDLSANQSGSSSTSSLGPPTTIETPEKLEKPKKSATDSEELRDRLKLRIDALRAARKADGPDGAPARNRQELMEARRKKELERKQHKKDLRLKAKAEEKLANEQVISARSSPIVGSPLQTPSADEPQNNFSFGNITFGDGVQAHSTLSHLVDARKRKGPQDPFGAMKAAESKQARINGLDEGKRKDIEEKDMWLNARKRAHGEKVRDDTSLLKKTLKRKEKAKSKSEAQWKEREEGVKKGQAMRQKKREDNLRKRREEKGGKGKKGSSKGGKKPKRPGFEGSFKGKTGSSKK